MKWETVSGGRLGRTGFPGLELGTPLPRELCWPHLSSVLCCRPEAHAAVDDGAHAADLPAHPGAPGAVQAQEGRPQLRPPADAGGAAGGGQDHRGDQPPLAG